jgi:two-component system chemotaxis response regulator CheB
LPKVFIVDDSPVSRAALRRLLQDDPEITFIGEATKGEEALDLIPKVAPDLVLMDIFMPGINGLETTRRLLQVYPRPVLIISDQVGGNAELSFEALRAGALDVIGKPSLSELTNVETAAALRRKIKLLAGVPVITRHGGPGSRKSPDKHHKQVAARVIERRAERAEPPRQPPPRRQRPGADRVGLVLLGASTGGPPALLRILTQLDCAARWPTVVVQHMTPGFMHSMVSWLHDVTGQEIAVAEDGIEPEAGVVYVAGDGYHLEIEDGHFRLNQNPPLRGHRPAIDATLSSVALCPQAERVVAVLLTGMGEDGAKGLKMLRDAGAWTIAQDERSSVVYGMPKAAIQNGAACEELSLAEIATYLANISR